MPWRNESRSSVDLSPRRCIMAQWWRGRRVISPRNPRSPRPRALRPTLEVLDDRCLPAVGGFLQTNLVSDVPGLAAVTDPHLVNAWGLVAGPATPWWISDNGQGVSTLYNGNGVPQPPPPNKQLVVTIPPPSTDPTGQAAPTGV